MGRGRSDFGQNGFKEHVFTNETDYDGVQLQLSDTDVDLEVNGSAIELNSYGFGLLLCLGIMRKTRKF
ncbi:MAG: hypothetical protein ACI9YL_000503 [Luteibaculaceae bacterium]